MTEWKAGRGKMGFMMPLMGRWMTTVPNTPMGKVVCSRQYSQILGHKFIRLEANWDIGDGAKTYQEIAHYGLSRDKIPSFWSFTSDGGVSTGTLTDVSDMHDGAKGFSAQMPSGLARFGFWPTKSGMMWAADAQTKTGWSSMIRHECVRVS